MHANSKAYQVMQNLESACADAAYSEVQTYEQHGYAEPDKQLLFGSWKEKRCPVAECYADWLYDDYDFIYDIVGESIHSISQDPVQRGEICLAVLELRDDKNWIKAVTKMFDHMTKDI